MVKKSAETVKKSAIKMPKLHLLASNRSNRKKKRVGRGISSGHGKTSCRGGKGQGARSGFKRRYHYIGGAQPIHRKHPIRGFSRGAVAKTVFSINLGWINQHFEAGETCNLQILYEKGFLPKRLPHSLKILGKGADTFEKKIIIEAHSFSKSVLAHLDKIKAQYRLLDSSQLDNSRLNNSQLDS